MRKTRLGLGVVVLGLALAGWWGWRRPTDLGATLPAETVSVAILDDPAAVARRVDALAAPLGARLGRLQPWLLPPDRAARLGFDPLAGFQAIGLGPRGAAIARLSALAPPVLCLDLVDSPAFARWIGGRAGEEARLADGHLVVGARRLPAHTRNGWTCIAGEGADAAELQAAFASDAPLSEAPLHAAIPAGPGLRGAWSARQATRWAHRVARPQLAADLGHLAAYVATASARIDAALDLQIGLTPEGQALADRLFAPGATRFGRYLAREGWAAARLAVALETAPDALATALPPSAPASQRQAISLGRMALPMTAGISWNQLTTALSGQIAVGVDLRVADPKPPRLLVLGIADQPAAKAAVEALARKFGTGGGLFGAGTPLIEEVGGAPAWRLHFEAGDAWVHLATDAVIVGSSPEALALALGGQVDADPTWQALDAPDAVLALAGDLGIVAARLPEGAPKERLGARLGLAIRRAPPGLTLRSDAATGLEVDALVALGLWAAGRPRE